ncbi:AsmA family protein [Halomonas sp. BC04]|uniref:AsmA family protein n=1 Tax=Halomonas sp. BC04 TaxID=1403540 RepID=UPI0004B73A77
MKRLLQTLLAAIGVLGVAVVAAVVYVTTFLDPEDFKPRLIDVVREHSGMELTLNGPLAWSFYPRLGVSVERVESHLPEQASDAPPFLAFDKAEVSLAFAPLLRGEIAIEGLTLDGMQLRLVRDEQGQGNWEPLLQRLDERREGLSRRWRRPVPGRAWKVATWPWRSISPTSRSATVPYATATWRQRVNGCSTRSAFPAPTSILSVPFLSRPPLP